MWQSGRTVAVATALTQAPTRGQRQPTAVATDPWRGLQLHFAAEPGAESGEEGAGTKGAEGAQPSHFVVVQLLAFVTVPIAMTRLKQFAASPALAYCGRAA
eukprot:3888209-Pleurochrysis_carterae.AAC.1